MLIAANSTISSVGHSISPSDRHLNTFGAVTIEKNVWIGVGVILLQGVNIGTNSIISAGSLVQKVFLQMLFLKTGASRITR